MAGLLPLLEKQSREEFSGKGAEESRTEYVILGVDVRWKTP